MNGLKPYERASGPNFTALQQARREEAAKDQRILKARAPLDRLQGKAFHAQRLLREVVDGLPPANTELRRHATDLAIRACLLATGIADAADDLARNA